MASTDERKDYDQTLRILSNMEYSKPVALVTISQKTGIKLAELIRHCSRLEKEQIIRRTWDNGNTFYILVLEDYHKKIDELMAPSEAPDAADGEEPARQSNAYLNSREAILKRRSMRAAKAKEEAPGASKNAEPQPKKPERVSAMDLMAIRRSSMANRHVMRNTRTNVNPAISQSADAIRPVVPGQTRSGTFRKPGMMSSSYNKAVYINKPTRGSRGSRSMFSAPAGDYLDFERTDTNFKQKENIDPPSLGPLIPFKSNVQTSNELGEAEVRARLGIKADENMITFLTPNPCHALWAACSAMTNSGGGTIILGMKRYGKKGEYTYFVKSVSRPEAAIKNLLRAFNDRSVISDCPKDPNFIEIVEFGRKKLLAVRLDPAQFYPAPLYTSHDSFCARDVAGCYLFKNDEVVHCSEEEVRALWQSRRIGDEVPDWDQTSEQLAVNMEHKVRLNIPAGFDDEIRPMSRKDCTFGQVIEHRFQTGLHRAYPGRLPPEREPQNLMQLVRAAQIAMNAAETTPARPGESKAASKSSKAAEGDVNPLLERLLIAEDIRAAGNSEIDDVVEAAPAAALSKPPRLPDACRAELEALAAPASDHPRLPTIRLAEITASMLRVAQLRPAEIAELLSRKMPQVRDKVLPKVRESNDVQVEDGFYYIV